MMSVEIDSEGRIKLPRTVQRALGVEPGDALSIEVAEGVARLAKTKHPIAILGEYARRQYAAGEGITLEEFARKEGIDLDGE
jgi:bifunctional DNA-binding transcriptional regulator/antitoxin component of YhaV-PrlF toxin-antitoxin module